MLQDRVKLQLVRLLIETFSTDPSLSFLNSAVSNTITNSKSKECGPLQLHDLNPSTSCTKGNFVEYNIIQNVRSIFSRKFENLPYEGNSSMCVPVG